MNRKWQQSLGILLCTFPALVMARSVTTPPADYFDPPVDGAYRDAFRVVGSITPPAWSWGRIELLEGDQKYRTEGYNLRTQKQRYQDTWQDEDYPLRTYFGELNQEIVDAFNLYYHDPCGERGSQVACPDPGPTRPEARFVVLQIGPQTATLSCDTDRPPVLLVHGAMQNGNVWLYPNGNDGRGNPYPGTGQLEGFVQALEQNAFCTYALTYGNFHGDNFSQAINLSNAIDRIKQLTGQPKVDVVAWSKGVISVDVYLSRPAQWQDWGDDYFDQIAERQAAAVPDYDNDVRVFVSLSGTHLGLDLNWRHPYDDLLILSTAENAPIGEGPVVWGSMMAVQCATWGYYDSPDDPFWPNNAAYGLCDGRGGTWLDYWNRIYTSNIDGLDSEGRPVYTHDLEKLNISQGLPASAFDFDKYNLAMWGSVTSEGRFRTAYAGQLQLVNDFRDVHPVDVPPESEYASMAWYPLDTDYYNWWQWLELKIGFNPYWVVPAGELLSPFRDCRESAFEPDVYPCEASHVYVKWRNAEALQGGKAVYRLFDGIGIDTAKRMGGNFVQHLSNHGVTSDIDYLYMVHGTSLGPDGMNFEYDAMACPTCDPHGDAVAFEESIGRNALEVLTRSWSDADRTRKTADEPVALSHLEMGVSPDVWDLVMAKLLAVD